MRPWASICFDRVAQRRAGRGGAEAFRRRDGAFDQRGGGKDARGVVDEDDVGRGVALRLEPGAHALLPAVAAERRRAESGRGGGRKEGERGFVARAVVGVDDDGRRAIGPRRRERLERVADQRLAGAGEVLFRRRRAEPRAAPGRHDDEGDAGRQAALTLQARPDADRPAAQG